MNPPLYSRWTAGENAHHAELRRRDREERRNVYAIWRREFGYAPVIRVQDADELAEQIRASLVTPPGVVGGGWVQD